MKAKLHVLIAVLVLAVLVLAACTTTQTPQPAAEPTAPSAAPTKAATEPEAPAATEPAAAPEATAPAAESADGPVTLAIPSEVLTLDPQLRDNVWTRAVLDNIYESLLWRDDDGTIVPLLAESLPEQVDETTWRFTIREGITFSNGEPLDANAVAASVERIIDPDYGSELAPLIDTIAGAEVVDERTVDVKTKEFDPILPARMVVIKMVPPEQSQDPSFAESPAGTGPYMWVSGTGAGPIELRKNPDYWGGDSATIESVIIRAIEEVSTRISALNAGEVDLVTVLPPDAAGEVPKVVSTVGIENPNVVLNGTARITADVRVRRALNFAVDKEAIAEELFAGYAQVSKCQIITPSAFGYDPNLEPYPYDPEQARALLEEAGVVGETVTLVTSDVFPKGREMGEVIAAYWRAVGLDVDLQTPEFDQYIEALYAVGEQRPEGVYLQTSTDLLDADRGVTRLLLSDTEAGEYSNPEVDEKAQQARESADPAERERLYHEILQTACDEAAVVFLLNPEDVYGTSERLQFTPRFDQAVLFATMSVSE